MLSLYPEKVSQYTYVSHFSFVKRAYRAEVFSSKVSISRSYSNNLHRSGKDSAASSSVLNYQWYQGVGFATFLQYMNISVYQEHIYNIHIAG